MNDVFFSDKQKSERQAILKDAYRMISGDTAEKQVETSNTVDAD